MDSQKLSIIPVIHFSIDGLKTGSSSWNSISGQVRRAFEDFGCFEAIYDKFSSDIQNEIFTANKELFELLNDVKSRYTSDIPLYGYNGLSLQAPFRESMAIKDATIFDEIQSFTNLMWPQGNQRFRDIVHEYSNLLSELDEMVERMVFDQYDILKHHENHVKSTCYLLRMMKYYMNPNYDYETNVGCNPHFDMSFTTILHQNQVNGLQIQTKDGRCWIDVSPTTSSSFIVMAGYPFTAWSNGRIHAAIHRVIMRENKVRHSLALFSFNTGEILTPDELVDEEHPLMYKPFDHIKAVVYFTENKGALPK